MASQEEINNQEELNQLLSERRGIDQESLNDVRDYANVLQDQLKQLSFQVTEKKKIGSISRNISKIAQQNYSILENELGTEKLISKIQSDKQQLIKNISDLQSFQNTQLGDNAELNANIQDSITGSIQSTKALIKEMDFVKKVTAGISNDLGVKTFGAISDIAKAIPGFNKFASPFRKAEEAARKQVVSNLKISEMLKTGEGLTTQKVKELGLEKQLVSENGKILTGTAAAAKARKLGLDKSLTSMSGLKAGAISLGNSLKKSLGPLFLLNEVVEAFKASDKIVGDMAKGLNMSYSEALSMKQELSDAANSSNNMFITSKGMAESLMAINKTLGTNVMLNKEDLATFTELRAVAGFTNEELMGIQALSLATGTSLEDNTKEFMAQAKISSIQNGVMLNEKELAKEIGNISAATTLTLGKNPKLLGQAAAATKSLGMEMSKVESIANSLLQFESSIENELQAELLLGRDINLEKARQAALNGDIATVAEEIAKQAGTAAEFGKMNVLQQEALAKSVGMSREELAKSLFVQEQLAGATGKEAEEKERILNARIAEVGLAQATSEIQEKGFESLKNQASMQDRFNASVEKLKELFVLVAESLMPIMDILSPILNSVSYLVNLVSTIGKSFGGIGGILLGIIPILMKASFIAKSFAMFSFKGAIAAIFRSFSAVPFGLGIPLAIAAVAGLGTLISSAASKVGDINSPAKGKTQISTKEGGLFELSPNDDIVAAPGASAAMARATQPQQTTVVQNDNTESKETNALLRQILSKQGTIKLDSTDMGTAMSVNRYAIQ